MSIFWLDSTPIKVNPQILNEEMFEDRYFLPGKIHGGEDYLIRVYLNDAHYEAEDGSDFDQFEVEYIPASLIIEADELDPLHGDAFRDHIAIHLESFGCPNDGESGEFAAIVEAWPDAIPMTEQDLVDWAKTAV